MGTFVIVFELVCEYNDVERNPPFASVANANRKMVKINDITKTLTGIKRIGMSQGLAVELYPKDERIDITSKRNKISFSFRTDTVKIFADDFECKKKYSAEEIEKVLEKVLASISRTGGFKFGIAII